MVSTHRYHGPLLHWAETTPQSVVVSRGDAAMTYETLAAEAGKVAAALRKLGIRDGDRVALLIDGHEAYLTAYYAILLSGGTAVPICPDLKGAALSAILRHSGARAVFAAARQIASVKAVASETPALEHVIAVNMPAERASAHGALALDSLITGDAAYYDGAVDDALAAIHYTSGTTGAPKGVMLSHRNLTANAISIVDYLSLTKDDRAAMVLPFFYVYGSSVLHTHVHAGAEIRLLGSMAFVANVVKGIEAHRCTGLSGVPSTFAKLLGYSGLADADLSSLRYVTQAGAAMKRAMCDRVRSAVPTAEVFVMYGQTEASARLTYLPPKDLDQKAGSVGIGIPGVEISVRRKDGSEADEGEVGEVYAKGANISVGYLDAPEKSAEVFTAHGLKTGDLGYKDSDGYLFLIGRESDMIKSGGHRISPSEIEEVIMHVPGVRESAVIGAPDEELGEAVIAYVVRESAEGPDENTVMRACLNDLPRFKLPKIVLFVEDLPKTTSGKIQRRALREAHIAQQSPDETG